MKRYRYISLGVPLLSGAISCYLYFSQNIIATVSLGFKSVSNETNSPTNAFSKMLGENNDTVSPQEIIEIASSQDFLHAVASAIMTNENFDKLNLNPFSAKKIEPSYKLFPECEGDTDCQTLELSKKLKDFIDIRQHSLVKTKFFLDVKTLDLYTSRALLKIVTQAMVNSRIESMRRGLSEQRSMTHELIEKKTKELNNINFAKITNEFKLLAANYESVERRLIDLNAAYQSKQFEVGRMEIVLRQTDNAINRGASDNDREIFSQQETLRNQISQMTRDIHSFEMQKGSWGTSDGVILAQLKREWRQKKNELARLPSQKHSVTIVDKFIEQKDRDSNFTNFEYMVAKQELVNLKTKTEFLSEEKKQLVTKKNELEQKLEQLKPGFEYLKLLEGKQVQIELLESTIVPDIVFDQRAASETFFKRAEKEKIGIFSILISLFVMFCVLVYRYLFDSRIFNEVEAKRSFDGVEIIGVVPDFEQF